MNTTFPPPLVPACVALQDFSYMPLDVRRLRDSRLAACSTGEEFMAAVLLWCASWHQQPAASLPDDDVELAHLSGYGRAVKKWQKVRQGALHGWIKCSDGRLYHPVLAEKAVESWNEKVEHRYKKEVDRLRKENQTRKEQGIDPLPSPLKPLRIAVHVRTEASKGAPNLVEGIRLESALNSAEIPSESRPVSAGIPAPPLKEFPGIPGLRESKGKEKGKGHSVPIGTDARAGRAALCAPELPEWLPEDVWQDWMSYRKSHKSRFTAKAAELSLRELAKLHTQGFEPRAVIEQSIVNGWTGLFPLKSRAGTGPPKCRQNSFETINYREGIAADGSF